jgi:DNA-directed RNA polymerase subunit RPC12/RpoP
MTDTPLWYNCIECWAPLDTPTKAEKVCSGCRRKRLERFAASEAAYPSAASLGLLGSTGDLPGWIMEGMRGRQRRVIRKSEPMG